MTAVSPVVFMVGLGKCQKGLICNGLARPCMAWIWCMVIELIFFSCVPGVRSRGWKVDIGQFQPKPQQISVNPNLNTPPAILMVSKYIPIDLLSGRPCQKMKISKNENFIKMPQKFLTTLFTTSIKIK